MDEGEGREGRAMIDKGEVRGARWMRERGVRGVQRWPREMAQNRKPPFVRSQREPPRANSRMMNKRPPSVISSWSWRMLECRSRRIMATSFWKYLCATSCWISDSSL